MARGERIYGVNTGVGGNVGISLPPEKMELLQHNLVRHLALRHRAAAAERRGARGHAAAPGHLRDRRLRGAPGIGRTRWRRCSTAGITPVVPRYGSVGA